MWFVNVHCLRNILIFALPVLTSGFSETNPDAPSPIRQYAYESEYDYESDSDLDEFEETDGSAHKPSVAGPSSAKGKGRDNSKDDLNPTSKKPIHQEKRHRILLPSIAHRT